MKLYTEKLGVANLVMFKGVVPQRKVKHYIKAADVVLIPPLLSFTLLSPITLFEYMASRKPIIAPNIASIREVLENEKDALLYDDIHGLANALVRLLSNAELAEKLAINAYHKVLHKYSHKQRALKIINALKELENINPIRK